MTFCIVVRTSSILSLLKWAVPTMYTFDPLGQSNTVTVSGRVKDDIARPGTFTQPLNQ